MCTASQHKAIFFTVISELFSSQVCLLVLWYTLNLSPPKVYGNFKQNTSTKIKKVVLKGDNLSWSVHISSYMEVPSINCNFFFLVGGGDVLKLCLGTKNRVWNAYFQGKLSSRPLAYLWSEGCRFDSWQGQQENFLHQDQLSVVTLISVSVPVTAVACKRSRWFCKKCMWQVTLTAKHTCTHLAYLA